MTKQREKIKAKITKTKSQWNKLYWQHQDARKKEDAAYRLLEAGYQKWIHAWAEYVEHLEAELEK